MGLDDGEGIALQPLMPAPARGQAADPTFPRTTDRKGFFLTKETLQQMSGGAVQLSEYEDFDFCIPFRRDPVQAGDSMLSLEEVTQEVMKICRARRPECHPADYDDPQSLHEMYQLHDKLHSMTREKLHRMLVRAFIRYMKSTGSETRIELNDAKDTVFVLTRMKEDGAMRVADKTFYPLRMDIAATPHKIYLEDPAYVAPFHIVERSMEEVSDGQGAMKMIGRIWERYDRIGNPVRGMFPASDPEVSHFRDVDRMRLQRTELVEYWDLGQMVRLGYTNGMPFPLHQPPRVDLLKQHWCRFDRIFTFDKPVDEIRNYFGEEIGLYFAFVTYYTRMLRFPAVAGGLLFIFQCIFDYKLNFSNTWVNLGRTFYCFFMCGWVTWFYQQWARDELIYKIHWGMQIQGLKRSPRVRTDFKGETWIQDPVVPERWIEHERPWKSKLRKVLTTALLGIALLVACFIVNDDFNVWTLRILGLNWLRDKYGLYTGTQHFLGTYLGMADWYLTRTVIATLVLVLVIKLLDKIWKRVFAYSLTGMENNKFDDTQLESVSLKLFSFKFFSHFTPLIYYAFFKEFIVPCDDMKDGRCNRQLAIMLTTLFLVGVLDTFKDLVVPLAHRMSQEATLEVTMTHEERLTEQFNRPFFLGPRGIINDWLEIMVQFGLVSLFSVMMPILPAIALLANLFGIQYDAWKLMHQYQRPFPETSGGIGFWQQALKTMGYLAICSNIVLCSFTASGHGVPAQTKLLMTLGLLIAALTAREYIQWKAPPESLKSKLLLGKMAVSSYFAIWGDDEDFENREKNIAVPTYMTMSSQLPPSSEKPLEPLPPTAEAAAPAAPEKQGSKVMAKLKQKREKLTKLFR